jgi:membrane fusion protein, multidrug efflux system
VVFISPYFQAGAASGIGTAPNTVLVKAEFPNLTGRIKTGMKVKNRIITHEKRQLAVPVQAVLMQASQPFVYRIAPLSAVAGRIKASDQVPEAMKKRLLALPGSTSIVFQAKVELGRLQGNLYPVLGGLAEGDRVVISNTALLRSGLPVREAATPASAEG